VGGGGGRFKDGAVDFGRLCENEETKGILLFLSS
jgi:hypothetical protein